MKLFELYNKRPVRKSRTLCASLKLCESTIRAIQEASYEGGIDFDPDPAYAGAGGINRDTGSGIKDAKAAEQKQQNLKINQTWQKLVRNMGKLDSMGAKKLKFNLQKLAKTAQARGFELSPSPESVLK